jgi:murein DD-endopeptidase MepM/ murein hydrolase activator NlpD
MLLGLGVKRRGSRKSVPHHLHLPEPLEGRVLLTANLHILSVCVTDNESHPITSPVIGTFATVRVDFTTTDLPPGASYTISQTVGGVTSTTSTSLGAGTSGTHSWSVSNGWAVKHTGQTTAAVTLDSQNTVAETDEVDNTGSVTVTPLQLPLPSKLVQPLGGVPFRDYGITFYVDQDPASPSAVDYRGGTYTYDGHDGIDFIVPSFKAMDDGTPVFAAAAGTVISAADGCYDRNIVGGSRSANCVVIDSGNGWLEYYWHLREGSVGVSRGQTVAAGQVIGMVGSSGDSNAAHLHFALYNGEAVETQLDPCAYWQTPLPYQGDVDEVVDAGVTNFDPTAMLDARERPPEHRVFRQLSYQKAYAWFSYYSADNKPGDITFYRGGVAYYTYAFNTGSSLGNRGGWFCAYANLPNPPNLGSWQVRFAIGGIELRRESFSITDAGSPAVRVDKGTVFVPDGRTTPIDGGTFTKGQTSAVQTFTITNFGDATLTLGSPAIPAGWILVTAPASSLNAVSSTTLSLRADTSIAGHRYGILSFATNDPCSPSYDIAIAATVNPSGAVPAVSLFSRDTAAAEAGLDPGVFRIVRSGNTSSALTVNLTCTGTATSGSDFVPIPSTLTLLAGQSSVSVVVTPLDDSIVESNESVTLSLTASAAYTLAPASSATVTIADNDGTGTASISGSVYLDKNFNTYRDALEVTLAGVSLFLDSNADGIRQDSEVIATTNASGDYTFPSLVAGSLSIRVLDSSGYIFSLPAGTCNVAAGQAKTDVNFGAFPITITGTNGFNTFALGPLSAGPRIQFTANGTIYSALRAQLPSLTFSGGISSDKLTLDLSAGLPKLPLGFSGGGGFDILVLSGLPANQDLQVCPAQVLVGTSAIACANIHHVLLDAPANSTLQLDSLTLTAPLVLPVGKTLLLRANALSIADQGSLDLADSQMILDYSGLTPTPAQDMRQWVFNGQVGSTPNICARRHLAAIDNALIHMSSFAGQSLSSPFSQVLIMRTLGGDANLDGEVNERDILPVLANMGRADGQWIFGDLNQDGQVDLDDYALISATLGEGAATASNGGLNPSLRGISVTKLTMQATAHSAAKAKPKAKAKVKTKARPAVKSQKMG